MYREIVRLIEEDGWRLVRQRGSHAQYAHPTKPGKATIAGHPNTLLGSLHIILPRRNALARARRLRCRQVCAGRWRLWQAASPRAPRERCCCWSRLSGST
jgi:predicted RNA binding protein YcfA (HicA-like mRNA interferase family)